MSPPEMPAHNRRRALETVRFWAALSLLLVTLPRSPLPAQTVPPNNSKQAAVESHFAAAQQAQRDRDYTTAEREYQAVLALSPEFAEVHLNLGLVYQLEERLPEAMAEFRRALKIKPALVGANFFLGVDYCKLGEGRKAIPYLKSALRAESSRPDIWVWLATAEELSGELDSEVATLDQALELNPKDIDLLYLLGSAYERLGKREVVHLQKVAPGSARSEQLLAQSYAESNEWPSSVMHFQNALRASPDLAGLHVQMGEVLLRAGKENAAIREFNNELQRYPGSLRALVRRGEARLIQQDLNAALEDWEKAVGVDLEQTEKILGLRETGFGDSSSAQLPDASREKILKLAGDLETRNTAASHLALGFLALLDGNLARATSESGLAEGAGRKSVVEKNCTEAAVAAAIQREEFSSVAPCAEKVLTSRTPSELRFRLASAFLESGQAETALKTLHGLPPADRESAQATYWRARCYEKLATAAYLRLYQADPNSYRLHQLMGDLEAAKGDDQKAMEEYRAAIALKPSSPNLHYSLGHLLWKNVKVPEARAELDRELALNPRHPGALNDLGDTYLLEHQPAKALPYLERALAADSGNSDIQRDIGTAYLELGEYPKAGEHFKLALSDDRDGSVHYKLGKVYQAMGERELAKREFALSSELNRKSHENLEKQTERLSEVSRFAEAP